LPNPAKRGTSFRKREVRRDFTNRCLDYFETVNKGEEEEGSMSKGFGNILKQAQQMHTKIAQLQEEMAGKIVEASSGGGMVNIVMNGKQEVLSVRIDPEVVNKEDIEMLQDLIAAAVNEAIRKSQEMMTEEMKKITGGLSVPGLF
jgi:hypothetical protein